MDLVWKRGHIENPTEQNQGRSPPNNLPPITSGGIEIGVRLAALAIGKRLLRATPLERSHIAWRSYWDRCAAFRPLPRGASINSPSARRGPLRPFWQFPDKITGWILLTVRPACGQPARQPPIGYPLLRAGGFATVVRGVADFPASGASLGGVYIPPAMRVGRTVGRQGAPLRWP